MRVNGPADEPSYDPAAVGACTWQFSSSFTAGADVPFLAYGGGEGHHGSLEELVRQLGLTVNHTGSDVRLTMHRTTYGA